MDFKRLIATITVALAITACASSTAQYQPPESFDNFTTNGKPTKTVETPWGDKQVYDPTQDPEVIVAFDYVYEELPKILRSLDDESLSDDEQETLEQSIDRDFQNAFQLFTTIRDVQENDLLRLGCSKPINTRHCDFEDQETITTIPKSCETISYGEASLNVCEKQNSSWISKDIIALAQSPCVTDLSDDRHALMSHWQIGQKNNPKTETITDKNLPVGKRAQLESYFLSECRKFYK